MAIAIKAKDRRLNRYVAIKFARDLADRKQQTLLVQEAIMAATVSYHPHIVTILDVVVDPDGVPGIVMEYVPDASTAQEFTKNILSTRKDALTRTAIALYVAYCGAKALQFSHERDIVHRDLKPGNILVSILGAVKLTDFGLAKILGQATRAVTGKGGGTVLYQAPEQFSGKDASVRTDLYQLGCTLYELLEGEAPHAKAVDDATLLFQKLVMESPDPTRMKGLNVDERSALLRLYKALISKDASKRLPAHQAVECISGILFKRKWVINISSKKGPIPKDLADRAFAITRFECFSPGRRGKNGAVMPPCSPLEYNDPQEALEETVALLMAGLSDWIYLTGV